MYKRSIAFVIVFMMMFSWLIPYTNAASIYNRQKKNIYFVIDDSGSMDNRRQYDTNYSLQSLIAMCDKDDKVSLFFLNSKPNKPQELNMASKDNQMIKSVKDNYPKSQGGTPYNAVTSAQRQLVDSVSAGDETEHWLVILTDGAFDGGSNPAADLTAFSQTLLANGTYPNVLFISIGGAVSLKSQGTLHYISRDNIITAMNEAAKTISGRVEVTPTFVNGNTEIKFKVPYPARNIVVFSQNNEIKITSYNSSSKLDISENYNVEYPLSGQGIGKSTVCFVKESGQSSIAAGDISFVFDKPVSADTMVLVEPAIGLTANFFNQDGQEIDPADLRVGETVKVKYSLCDSETKQPLDESAFGGKVKYYSNINGADYSSKEFDFVVDKDSLNIDMYAELPDGYVMNYHNSYSNLQTRRDIILTLSNGGNFKSDYDKLRDAEGIYANILINGNPIDEMQLNDFDLKIKGNNRIISNFSVTKDGANGRFVIKPKAGLFGPLTPKQKTYDVILKDKQGSTYTAKMNVEIPGLRDWIGVLLWILGLYVLGCQIFKKRFPMGTVFEVYGNDRPSYFNPGEPHVVPLWKLYCYELKHWDALKHLAIYLFTTGQRVTLYEIAEGEFEHIELRADTRRKILGKVRGLNKDTAKTYSPDFEKLDTSFSTPADVDDYDYRRLPIKINEVLSKCSEGYYVYDVRFTTKRERKRRE